MDYVRIEAGEHELGWRHSDRLPKDARAGLASFLPMDQLLERFSKPRRVALPAFSIASSASFTVEELLGDVYELDVDTLGDVCDACDAALAERGLRLPTEDELEAAFGGGIFFWGDQFPDGAPYGDETESRLHREPTSRGLTPLGDPYHVELTRTALKLGDGGEALCGGYPWPVPWLAFCPSFRLAGEQVEDLLFESLETTHIRPVRLVG